MGLPHVLAAVHISNSSPKLILCLTPSLPNNHKSGNEESFFLSPGNLELPETWVWLNQTFILQNSLNLPRPLAKKDTVTHYWKNSSSRRREKWLFSGKTSITQCSEHCEAGETDYSLDTDTLGPETWRPLLCNQQHQHHRANCSVVILLDGAACKSGESENCVAHHHCRPLALVYSSVKTVVWGTFLIKIKIEDWKDCSESTDISCRIWCPACIPGFTLWKESTDLHKHTAARTRISVCTHMHTHTHTN